jgi:hypothetical protein
MGFPRRTTTARDRLPGAARTASGRGGAAASRFFGLLFLPCMVYFAQCRVNRNLPVTSFGRDSGLSGYLIG